MAVKTIKPLTYKKLCTPGESKQFKFNDTSELTVTQPYIGQQRAVEAIKLGLSIAGHRHHIYALGSEGVGKKTIIEDLVKKHISKHPTTIYDWAYLHNFKDLEKPIALQLEQGMGIQLKNDLEHLITEIKNASTEINHLISKLRNTYKKYPAIISHLQHIEKFIQQHHAELTEHQFNCFRINLLVDNSKQSSAAIITEENPNYANLIGTIEFQSCLGTLATHSNLIRAGALHKANGGYIILDALKIVTQTRIWEALKHILLSQQLYIDTTDQKPQPPVITSLQPEAIPLNIKVILLGDYDTYYQLVAIDPEFNALFNIAADFERRIERNSTNEKDYAKLIATIARKQKLNPFNKYAVAKVIERACRVTEDSKKLSIHLNGLTTLLQEANFYCIADKKSVVSDKHVSEAIARKNYRLNRGEQLTYEEIERNAIIIDTKGKCVGQVNALSVIEQGDYSYGVPSRISAVTRLGKGELIDIEREVELGDSTHSKGVLILSGYLNSQYLTDKTASMWTSLVFEQSYGQIDGDSASAAELCAILSSLAGTPIKQSLAITGSINQFGEIQAIGGINEKIESFFTICQQKGLTGSQGVIIPHTNIEHLMLNQDVIKAAKNKKFHVYPVSHVNEALTLLTGISAGKRNKEGYFPKNSVNYLVEKKLKFYADQDGSKDSE